MHKMTAASLAVVSVLASACSGDDEPMASTGDCGSMLRYESTMYWGASGATAVAARTLGTGEEPVCSDSGSGELGPGEDSVREGLVVAAMAGIDPAVAVVLLKKPTDRRGIVFVQSSGPGVKIPDSVERLLIEDARQ